MAFPITPQAEKKIDAIVASITAEYFGTALYESPEEKAVAYFYFLINDHPFTDGNKRTASLAFATVCELNDLTPKFEGFTLDELAVLLEKEQAAHRDVIRDVALLLFG